MNTRAKKKSEKRKRAYIHEVLDLVLDINGLQGSKQESTGNHPTAFMSFSGHVGAIDVTVYLDGWANEEKETFGIYKYIDRCDNNFFENLIKELRNMRKRDAGR